MKNILNSYNKIDREYLEQTMNFLAIIGASCEIETAEQFKAWCDAELAKRDEREAKAKAAEAKKIAKEAEKAEAKGMTAEEYKEYTKKRNLMKRYESEARKIEKQIEELKKELAYKVRRAEELHKEIGE